MSYKNQWPTNRLLSTAARLVEHAWNENLASLGITHAGVMALDVLRSEGSMTQAQLAHQVRAFPQRARPPFPHGEHLPGGGAGPRGRRAVGEGVAG